MRLPIISWIRGKKGSLEPKEAPAPPVHDYSDMIAMIAVTYRCQCDCHHCGMSIYERNKSAEFSTEELKGIIRQCADMKCGSIHFFGGEPLVREDIIELVRYATDLGMGTAMDTNGAALDEEMGDKLAEAGMKVVMVSIDSTDPEVHDHQRRYPGIWTKAIRAVEILRDRGVDARIGAVVDREKLNNGDFANLLKKGDELGVKVRIFTPIQLGKWGESNDHMLTPEEIAQMKSMLVPGKFFWEQESCNGPDTPFFCGASAKGMIFITAYGDVTPCSAIPLSFGNVKKEPLAVIVERMFKHWIYQKKSSCTDCLTNSDRFREEFGRKFATAEKFPIKIDD